MATPPTLYLILLTYTAPEAEINASLEDHRAYLRRWYAAGKFMLSGPQVPATGGVVIARAASAEEAQSYVTDDPFYQRNLATHQVIPFLGLWSEPRLTPLLSEEA